VLLRVEREREPTIGRDFWSSSFALVGRRHCLTLALPGEQAWTYVTVRLFMTWRPALEAVVLPRAKAVQRHIPRKDS
jgi:hypothetical protein